MKRNLGTSVRLLTVALFLMCLTLVLAPLSVAGVSSDKLHIPDADKIQMIALSDGSMLTGRISRVEEDKVIFVTKLGEVTIPIDQIDDIREMSSSAIKGGKYWFPNPNRTRLYFAPTGRLLEAGKGYFSDLLLFFPSVSYGVTDNISIGGGMSLFPGVDFSKQLFYFFPRIGYQPSDKLALAGSMLILGLPDFDDDDDDDEDDLIDEGKVAGILFGTATYGTDIFSVTGGVGYGYVGDDFADKPAVLFGFDWRFSRRLSFVSENWIFPDVDQPLASYGLRFFGESLSADLGFLTPLGDDAIFPGFPLISFAWNF